MAQSHSPFSYCVYEGISEPIDGKLREKKTTTIKINGKESRVHFYVFYDNGFLSMDEESEQRKCLAMLCEARIRITFHIPYDKTCFSFFRSDEQHPISRLMDMKKKGRKVDDKNGKNLFEVNEGIDMFFNETRC